MMVFCVAGSVITEMFPASTRILPSAERNSFEGDGCGAAEPWASFVVVRQSAQAAGSDGAWGTTLRSLSQDERRFGTFRLQFQLRFEVRTESQSINLGELCAEEKHLRRIIDP